MMGLRCEWQCPHTRVHADKDEPGGSRCDEWQIVRGVLRQEPSVYGPPNCCPHECRQQLDLNGYDLRPGPVWRRGSRAPAGSHSSQPRTVHMKISARHAAIAAMFCVLPAIAHSQDAVASVATASSTGVKDALAMLKQAADQPAPATLSESDRVAYAAHTEWLQSAYQRLSVLTAREAASGMATGRSARDASSGVASGRAAREASTGKATGRSASPKPETLQELVAALQQESGQFNSLSNTSKVRHDIAMNAIRNMKG